MLLFPLLEKGGVKTPHLAPVPRACLDPLQDSRPSSGANLGITASPRGNPTSGPGPVPHEAPALRFEGRQKQAQRFNTGKEGVKAQVPRGRHIYLFPWTPNTYGMGLLVALVCSGIS